MKNIFFFLTCYFFISTSCAQSKQAVCIISVADLIGQPMEQSRTTPDIKKEYQTIPASDAQQKKFPVDSNAPVACPRIGQLLFNEQVTILQERGDEVKIYLPHIFYLYDQL